MSEKLGGIFPLKGSGKYILIPVLFLTLGCVLLYLTYRDVKREIIEDLNARQMIHAKQAVRGIETFFIDHINILENLSKNDHIAVLDETGKGIMHELQSSHSEEISIISREDSEGRTLHAEPYDPKVIGQPVTTMEYFEQAKRTNKAVASDVFTNRRGFKSIIVYVPIFEQGNFGGTLAMLLHFDIIARRYIEDIRIGKDGYAWVISRMGIEISCPVPGHVGNSVFDNYREYPDILAMAERMIRGEQGTATYMFDRARENIVSRTTKHAVFMPIRLGNNFWSIVVATPEDEVTSSLQGFRNRLLLIAMLLIIGMGLFFYMIFRTRLVVQEMEQRMRSEEDLDRYFMGSLDLLCIADTDGYFRKVNPEWEKTLGYALHELEGHPLMDFVHPDDREATLAAVGDLSKEKEVLNLVNRYHCKDGTYRWLEWRGYPSGNRIYATARDITQRKQAEEALRESEARYRAVIENMEDVFYRTDKEGNLILLSPSAARLLGIDSVEQIYGMNIAKEFYAIPEERARLLQAIEANGAVIDYDVTLERPDGSLKFVSTNSHVYRNADGEPLGVEGVFRDITERVRAEQTLRKNQRLSARAEEVGNFGYWNRDFVKNTVTWSQGCYRIFGVNPDEFQDSFEYFLDLVHPLDRESVKNAVEAAFSSRRAVDLEYRIIRPDGNGRVVRSVAETSFDESGQAVGLFGTTHDTTERKQAEQAVIESRNFLSEIVNAMADPVFVKDRQHCWVLLNDSYCGFMGHDREELIGKSDYDYFPAGEADVFWRKDEEVFVSGVENENEEHFTDAKGTTHTIITKKSHYIHTSGEQFLVGVIRDVTERKQAEEEKEKLQSQLRHVQKMEAIGTLAGGIAHDFNNILGIILGNAELAALDISEGNPSRQYLEQVISTIARAKDVVGKLLTFSRKTEENRRPVDLVPVIKEALKVLRSFIPTSIEFKENITDRCRIVSADPTQIHQIIMNLCTNAAHAMEDEGGILEFSLQNVDLGEGSPELDERLEPGEYVMLQIRDTGRGISPGILDRIFDPYFTTKEVNKGTGMGLAVVHGIVASHGGSIHVVSEPGRGTTFKICFPTSPGELPAETIPNDELPTGTERILFVDDEEQLAALGCLQLESLGYSVRSETNPMKALETFESDPDRFDLVITDMTMPGMMGDQLGRELLRIRPDIPVILCTGFSERMDEERAQSAGFRAYAMKPLERKKLAITVRRVLDKKM